ncbi:oxidoreductase [Parathielavia appendiculata]|uniref:Oxidoreductase n=1 Tax=Parathielavia appendiculata TaxID=2587402 RepID=A0AAN6TSU3_9PEZI|nr:oxidoreductase [Parathielavia appendiculata]
MPHKLTVKHKRGKPGAVYYPLQLHAVPKPCPGSGQLLVKIAAAALNHRDIFIRQQLYPGISFEAPLFSDACGEVVEAGPGCTRGAEVLNKLVVLTPFRGWATDPAGPEDWAQFCTIGGVGPHHHLGGAQTYVVVDEGEVEPLPAHLSAVEGAALPSAGVTAYRALFTKAASAAQQGRNILVTGIGGGVALQVLQLAVARGVNVYVTSGSEAKIARARQLGARDGVLYTHSEWPKELAKLLPAERPLLDAVVDGAGGDIVVRSIPLLRPGGVISVYGMTLAPVMDWPMQAVMKNIELRGTTLGSRVEFADFVEFVGQHKIRPVVSRSVKGLDCVDAIEGLFDELKEGKQFGKLVVEI